MTTAMAAETVIINDMKPSNNSQFGQASYYAENCNLQLNGNWMPSVDADLYGYYPFRWTSTEEGGGLFLIRIRDFWRW